jgi:hypothetical protein
MQQEIPSVEFLPFGKLVIVRAPRKFDALGVIRPSQEGMVDRPAKDFAGHPRGSGAG